MEYNKFCIKSFYSRISLSVSGSTECLVVWLIDQNHPQGHFLGPTNSRGTTVVCIHCKWHPFVLIDGHRRDQINGQKHNFPLAPNEDGSRRAKQQATRFTNDLKLVLAGLVIAFNCNQHKAVSGEISFLLMSSSSAQTQNLTQRYRGPHWPSHVMSFANNLSNINVTNWGKQTNFTN